MNFTPPTSPLFSDGAKAFCVGQTRGGGSKNSQYPLFPEVQGAVEDDRDSIWFLKCDLVSDEVLKKLCLDLFGDIETAVKWLGVEIDFMTIAFIKLSQRPIGYGSTSYVYGLEQYNDTIVKFGNSKKTHKTVLKEALVLAYLHKNSSKHIIPSRGITYMSKKHFQRLRINEVIPGLLLPRMDMSVRHFSQNSFITERKRIWWTLASQMLQALECLKRTKIIHGDIKSENILLDISKNEFYLADFTSAYIEGHTTNFLDTTLAYCPPEVISDLYSSTDKHQLSHSTDFYSMGLVLLTVITGDEPFQQLQKISPQHDSSSFQQTQWLMNVILQDDPIKYNLAYYDTDIVQLLQREFHDELKLVARILVDREPLESVCKQV